MVITTLSRTLCFVSALMLSARATAQEAPTILQVDYANGVVYVNDVNDPSKLASSTGPMASTLPKGFFTTTAIFDLTTVNGTPVKGVLVYTQNMLNLKPNPSPGQAISDVTRGNTITWYFEFMQPDGTQIGSLFALGFGGGTAMSGSPVEAFAGNCAIVGGTGAFLGARGTVQVMKGNNTGRSASQAEDPSMRRINGGGTGRYIFQIIPMYRPEVLVAAAGPVVFHPDFSPVTAAKPAQAGEMLILYAKNLGPTIPAVNPGDPFPEKLAVVTSPIEIIVNGKVSPAINQVGVPGTPDTYRVDFRVPDGTASGMIPIQLNAAWIKSAVVQIAVQ